MLMATTRRARASDAAKPWAPLEGAEVPGEDGAAGVAEPPNAEAQGLVVVVSVVLRALKLNWEAYCWSICSRAVMHAELDL